MTEPGPDPIEAVIDAARHHGVGVPEMLRLEALKWEFLARAPEAGRATYLARFPRYAAALLFSTPQEQAEFVSAATPLARPEVARAKGEARPGVATMLACARAWVRANPARAILAVTAVVAAAWLSVRIMRLRSDLPDPVATASPETELVISEPPPPPVAPRWDWAVEPWWLAVVAAMAMAAIGYVLWRRQRLERLHRDANANTMPLADIATRIGRARLFADPRMRAALRNLRRPRFTASSRIDVSASIRATLAAGRWPLIRFARQPLTPEYLILSEREVPQDHLTELGNALGERLDTAHIANSRYEFYGDPGRVRPAADRAGSFEPLESVLARHEGARLLLVMESRDALDEPGCTPHWLDTAEVATRPVLMNPRPKSLWSDEERALHAMGLTSFAADSDGVGRLAERIARDSDEIEWFPVLQGAPDLAAYLDRYRTMLLSSSAPEPERIERAVANLERGLDSGAMDWLRTIALFPRIGSGFTFFAGDTLAEQSLVTHQRYLAIARLPWLRAGQMPDWLRKALVNGFSPAKLDRALAVIHAYLMPPRGAPANREAFLRLRKSANGPIARRRLKARIAAIDNPLYQDALLLGALNGLPPDKLDIIMQAPRLPEGHWLRRPEVQGVAALLAAVALLTLTSPPIEQDLSRKESEPVATPSSPESKPSPTPVPAVEITPTPPPSTPTATPTPVPVVEITPTPPTSTPTATPTPPTLAPRVYVIVGNQLLEQQAQDLVGSLDGLPLGNQRAIFPAVQTRRDAPAGVQIRCFDDWTCDHAGELQKAVAGAGMNARIVRFRPEDLPGSTARENHYELWIGGSPPPPMKCVAGPYFVYFEWDRSDLRPEDAALLDTVVASYRACPAGTDVYLAGHQDRSGPASYAVGLSQRIVDSVRAYLEKQGIPSSAITSEAFGESQPRVPTADGVREPQNRRVEITLIEPSK